MTDRLIDKMQDGSLLTGDITAFLKKYYDENKISNQMEFHHGDFFPINLNQRQLTISQYYTLVSFVIVFPIFSIVTFEKFLFLYVFFSFATHNLQDKSFQYQKKFITSLTYWTEVKPNSRYFAKKALPESGSV